MSREELHPALRVLLDAGARAAVSALDSVLGDVEDAVDEASRRVRRARSRAKQIKAKR